MGSEEGERGRPAPRRRSFVLVPLPVSAARGADGDVRARRRGGACGTRGGAGGGLWDPEGQGTPPEAGLGPDQADAGGFALDAAGGDYGARSLRAVLQVFKH